MREITEAIIKAATDRGQIIEAGWLGLCIMSMPKDAPQVQYDEMRGAFFAGAQHLFASIMTILEPGAEPTEKDLNRMTMIQSELDEFLKQFKIKHGMPL